MTCRTREDVRKWLPINFGPSCKHQKKMYETSASTTKTSTIDQAYINYRFVFLGRVEKMLLSNIKIRPLKNVCGSRVRKLAQTVYAHSHNMVNLSKCNHVTTMRILIQAITCTFKAHMHSRNMEKVWMHASTQRKCTFWSRNMHLLQSAYAFTQPAHSQFMHLRREHAYS